VSYLISFSQSATSLKDELQKACKQLRSTKVKTRKLAYYKIRRIIYKAPLIQKFKIYQYVLKNNKNNIYFKMEYKERFQNEFNKHILNIAIMRKEFLCRAKNVPSIERVVYNRYNKKFYAVIRDKMWLNYISSECENFIFVKSVLFEYYDTQGNLVSFVADFGNKKIFFLKGKEFTLYYDNIFNIYLSGDSYSIHFLKKIVGKDNRIQWVTGYNINGKEYLCKFTSCDYFTFSSNGKSWGYRVNINNRKYAYIINNKMQRKFYDVKDLTFSEDGKNWGYFGQVTHIPNRRFCLNCLWQVVINGKLYPIKTTRPRNLKFSPNGKRWAYSGGIKAFRQAEVLIVDGIKKGGGGYISNITFSPNSKYYFALVNRRGKTYIISNYPRIPKKGFFYNAWFDKKNNLYYITRTPKAPFKWNIYKNNKLLFTSDFNLSTPFLFNGEDVMYGKLGSNNHYKMGCFLYFKGKLNIFPSCLFYGDIKYDYKTKRWFFPYCTIKKCYILHSTGKYPYKFPSKFGMGRFILAAIKDENGGPPILKVSMGNDYLFLTTNGLEIKREDIFRNESAEVQLILPRHGYLNYVCRTGFYDRFNFYILAVQPNALMAIVNFSYMGGVTCEKRMLLFVIKNTIFYYPLPFDNFVIDNTTNSVFYFAEDSIYKINFNFYPFARKLYRICSIQKKLCQLNTAN
jgi:hypothetical protein